MLTSALGARRTLSIATAYGTRNVVRQDQYRRLGRNAEVTCHGVDEVGALGVHVGEEEVTIAIVMSGRRAQSAGPQPLMLLL